MAATTLTGGILGSNAASSTGARTSGLEGLIDQERGAQALANFNARYVSSDKIKSEIRELEATPAIELVKLRDPSRVELWQERCERFKDGVWIATDAPNETHVLTLFEQVFNAINTHVYDKDLAKIKLSTTQLGLNRSILIKDFGESFSFKLFFYPTIEKCPSGIAMMDDTRLFVNNAVQAYANAGCIAGNEILITFGGSKWGTDDSSLALQKCLELYGRTPNLSSDDRTVIEHVRWSVEKRARFKDQLSAVGLT